MKRMIDGVINCLAESGEYVLFDDGETAVTIDFRFPEGYWPISLNSKPFSILPGHIDHANESDIAGTSCFSGSSNQKWTTVAFAGDGINKGNGYNYITYKIAFNNTTDREAFLKELYGEDIILQEVNTTPFAVPVYLVLLPFSGEMEY